jgi:hypothetical protein
VLAGSNAYLKTTAKMASQQQMQAALGACRKRSPHPTCMRTNSTQASSLCLLQATRLGTVAAPAATRRKQPQPLSVQKHSQCKRKPKQATNKQNHSWSSSSTTSGRSGALATTCGHVLSHVWAQRHEPWMNAPTAVCPTQLEQPCQTGWPLATPEGNCVKNRRA